MKNIRLIINEEIVDGKQISFKAPCDSSEASGLTINDVEYDIVNSVGESVLGVYNVWGQDSIVSVILNTTNNKAYIQNKHTPIRQICSLQELGFTEFPVTSLDVCEAIRNNVSGYFKLSCEVSKSEISDLPGQEGLLEIAGSSVMSLYFSHNSYYSNNYTGVTTVYPNKYGSTFVVTSEGISALSPWYEVFTEFSKPSLTDLYIPAGSYSGDGSTSREISLLGHGGAGAIIWDFRYTFAFCMEQGTFISHKEGDPGQRTVSWKWYPNVTFSSGKIKITEGTSESDNDHGLNYASNLYYYQVVGPRPR